MKTITRTLGLLVATLLFTSFATGAPALKYQGNLTVPKSGPHKEDMVSTQSYFFDAEKLTQVTLDLTAPVFGKKSLSSTEQEMFSGVLATGEAQVAAIFKLQGPPHKWYYVFVANSTDKGVSFSGTLFKAPAPIADIEAVVVAGVMADPANWKRIGTGDLLAK